jgi:hypothetical protein
MNEEKQEAGEFKEIHVKEDKEFEAKLKKELHDTEMALEFFSCEPRDFLEKWIKECDNLKELVTRLENRVEKYKGYLDNYYENGRSYWEVDCEIRMIGPVENKEEPAVAVNKYDTDKIVGAMEIAE